MPQKPLTIVAEEPLEIVSEEPLTVVEESSAPSGAGWLDLAKEGVSGLVAGVIAPVKLLKNIYDDSSAEMQKAVEAAKAGDLVGAVKAGAKSTPAGQSARVLGQMAGAQWDQLIKGKQAYDEGRTSEALGHTMAGLLPVLGPMAGATGEAVGSGDPRRAAHAVGELSSLSVPGAVARVLPKSVSVGGRFKNTNPAEAAAVEFGERAGIPIDAATATGNRVVRSAQWLSDQSLGGAIPGQRAARAQTEGLTRVAGELANRAHPVPVAPETAGRAVQTSLAERIAREHGTQTKAYGELAAMEKASEAPVQVGTRQVTKTELEPFDPEPAPPSFSKPDATAGQLFQDTLNDAKRMGFKGSPTQLKAMFDDAVKDAKARAADADEFGPKALLEAISRNGGLGDSKAMPGEMRQMWANSTGIVPGKIIDKGTHKVFASQSRRTSGGAIGGVKGVMKHDGKNFDDMIVSLREDGFIFNDINDLIAGIEQARVQLMRKQKEPLGRQLQAVGLRPGTRWWDPESTGNFREVQKTVTEPVMETMGFPIDLGDTRLALKPVYDRLLRESELVPLMGDKARALTALDRLMNGPKIVPASVADGALSELKAMSRFEGLPELRPEGKGAAALAVGTLEDQVQFAVAQGGGPKATAARNTGREATKRKYEVGDIFEELRTEPVKAYRQATAPGDQNIDYLRKLQRIAPKDMPKVGRAYLSDLFDKATAEGGFSRAQGLQAEWLKLGPETKRTLFPDAKHRADLDRFFLLAKKMAENPNPSGSALAGSLTAQGMVALTNPVAGFKFVLVGGALSKLLHSKVGVKLLTETLTIPLAQRAKAAAATSRVAALAGLTAKDRVALVPAFAGEDTSTPEN